MCCPSRSELGSTWRAVRVRWRAPTATKKSVFPWLSTPSFSSAPLVNTRTWSRRRCIPSPTRAATASRCGPRRPRASCVRRSRMECCAVHAASSGASVRCFATSVRKKDATGSSTSSMLRPLALSAPMQTPNSLRSAHDSGRCCSSRAYGWRSTHWARQRLAVPTVKYSSLTSGATSRASMPIAGAACTAIHCAFSTARIRRWPNLPRVHRF